MSQSKMPGDSPGRDHSQDQRPPNIRLICAKCEKEIHAYDLDCTIENGVIHVHHIFCGCPLGFIDLKGVE